jgi:hypothetical protein
MRIGIDISQIVHEGTGVATYVRRIVATLVQTYPEHEYILFGASLRKRNLFFEYLRTLPTRVRLIAVPIPPTLLDVLWNRLHVAPVEWFTGPLDIFWSSDWTQPPLVHARGITTIHDLSILRYPKESFGQIVAIQKRRLQRAKNVCQMFFCDSEATKKDAEELLGIDQAALEVVYPGL